MSIPDQENFISAALAAASDCFRALGHEPDLQAVGRPPAPSSMAGRIEHTLLGSFATDADVSRLCDEAAEHAFRAVCCLPRDVHFCARALGESPVLVVTVLDFPLAGGTTVDASRQCQRVIDLGADEVDMVVDIRALRRHDFGAVMDGVGRVVEAAGGKPVKVILETGLLTNDQIAAGCAASEAAGASFVKTCTGFGPRGASDEDIVVMRVAVGNRLGVKASGGISDAVKAARLVELGADVIGTSRGAACL